MSSPTSTSSRASARLAAIALAIALFVVPSLARAQACCAGGSAVTPARLELHEVALAGVQLRAAGVVGSYDPGGHYVASPSGDRELDFEQDLFGAVRVLDRGQVALLVPVLETWRQAGELSRVSRVGGGVGDINASLRYDLVVAGQSRYVPGIALLAGLTVPTGKPAESATAPLAVDATGIGAWQANVALALEQTYGPWLFNATGILAKRTARFGETLGTQVTLLAAAAFTFPNDAALALSASYALEGDATNSDGTPVILSSRRLTTATLSLLWPIDDAWRLLGSFFVEPPVSHLGTNQPAASGLSFTVIRSWS
jgi:hypothetical protein